MRILLVNDDGYTKDGILRLEEALSERGHEIWVVSPSSNRSAQSHAMSLSGPIVMTRYGENHYHCSGSPTDCILYAIKGEIFPALPDLVISGINHGYNCSSDILYSGTCSAASEAVLQGVRAMAVSAQADEEGRYDFASVAGFVADNMDALYSLTALGLLYYGDRPRVISDDGHELVLRMEEGEVSRTLTRYGGESDLDVCRSGRIALSVVMVNPALDEEAHRRAGTLDFK